MARGFRKSLVGMKFGKLEVISYYGTDKHRNSLWNCLCSCGKATIEKGTELTTGKIISCGKCDKRLAISPIATEQEEQLDKSIIGQRFGKLVVEDLFHKTDKRGIKVKYTKCKCDCGNEKIIALSSLISGRTKSCGCLKKNKGEKTLFSLSDDFIGQRFGKLVVDSYDTEKHKWKCICDCGNIKYLKKGNLTNNGYKSCGCGQHNPIKID